MGGSHHYAIDAGKLVEKCRSLLSSILDVMETNSSARAFQRRAFHLVTLADGKLLFIFIHIFTWSLGVPH